MRAMRQLRLNRLIIDLLALALHACDAGNGSMILVDDDTNELVFAAEIDETREHLLNHRIDIDTGRRTCGQNPESEAVNRCA